MRTFMVLCLIGLAVADKLPYNYAPVGHADNSYGRGEQLLSGPIDGQVATSNEAAQFATGGVGGGADAGVDKEFYTFTANEAEFEPSDASEQIANSVKQNLRVIFIKGPENKGLENAALSLAKHASEQRTAIYVLNKQTDIGELANKLQQEHKHHASKPEVHFVKYRTPEDAQNAQQAIQSQYDQLGGSSQNHNGGVAPVLDFASKAQIVGSQQGGAYADGNVAQAAGLGQLGAGAAPSGTYLPANFFRF